MKSLFSSFISESGALSCPVSQAVGVFPKVNNGQDIS